MDDLEMVRSMLKELKFNKSLKKFEKVYGKEKK